MSPEAKTAVVTDTTAYLPDQLIDLHGIRRVSLYVSLEGEARPYRPKKWAFKIRGRLEFELVMRHGRGAATTSAIRRSTST